MSGDCSFYSAVVSYFCGFYSTFMYGTSALRIGAACFVYRPRALSRWGVLLAECSHMDLSNDVSRLSGVSLSTGAIYYDSTGTGTSTGASTVLELAVYH